MELSARRDPRETEGIGRELKKTLKKVEKVLKKHLTKGLGCDIIVESPKSEEL